MSQPKGQVVFTVPDFTDADGITYSDIEILIEMNSIHDAARLAETLERPIHTPTLRPARPFAFNPEK